MGVPAFFRWLSRKYPSVIIECVEEKKVDPETGKNIYDDGNLPNPNGVEFDNLYLDMNGIIHPCTHPEDKPAPKNEDEMMIAIFECIDRLMNIVRPRKLLYMAIDGVAPRAKMNQQRSRRFRAAKEAVEKRLEIEKVRNELLAKGCALPPAKEKGDHFDSNCITPGTPFMERLSQCLHYYIHDRLNNNPLWSTLKVILSDANVPGEGEHKIMDYIRKQRSQPDHDPNTQHVLCGADADLIMLGLATHEPNFTIIREEFLPNKPKPCDVCNQFGHEMDKCMGLNSGGVTDLRDFQPDVPIGAEVKFIFVRLSVLREYLKRTLDMPNLPFKYEFERVVDDWVFMCFFVGNDFLPHLPSLEIREGAVDRLVELYKKCVYKTGGYLTDSGEVNLGRVQLILNDLGNVEDHIFKERQKREQQYKAREKSKRRRVDQYNAAILERVNAFELTPLGVNHKEPLPIIEHYKNQAATLRNSQGQKSASNTGNSEQRKGIKRSASDANLSPIDVDDDQDEYINDEVRLWEDGFKDRYYESKFDVGKDNMKFRYSVALQYVRGLCWVLKYYYQGCASWNWYFPYHYAPFASDFINISGLSTDFEKNSKPFDPLEQLMGVFPAASSSHVPKPWAQLMSDPNSDIIDFYPEDFKIDLNGKKFAWQGVALLPFVQENRLFQALKPYYSQLSEEEIKRNKRGDCRLYIGRNNPKFKSLYLSYKKNVFEKTSEVTILLQGMLGIILKSEENVPQRGTLSSPIINLHDITDNDVITVRFRDPIYSSDHIFPAKRLPNAIDPPNILAPETRVTNYRPRIGFNPDLPQAFISSGAHRLLNNTLNVGSIPLNVGSSSFSVNVNYQQQHYSYSQNNNNLQNNNWIRGSRMNNNNNSNTNCRNNNNNNDYDYYRNNIKNNNNNYYYNNNNRHGRGAYYSQSYQSNGNNCYARGSGISDTAAGFSPSSNATRNNNYNSYNNTNYNNNSRNNNNRYNNRSSINNGRRF